MRKRCACQPRSNVLTLAYYRDQLKENALLHKYFLDVDIGDLIKFNEELSHRLVTEPAEIIPLVSRDIVAVGSGGNC